VLVLERDAAVGAAKLLVLKIVELGAWFSVLVLDEMLAFRLGVAESEAFVETAVP
jgi:hypothetical protein